MSNLDSLLERNQVFAAQQSAAGTLMPSLPQALPNVKAIIIGCADMRVDPAHILGIKPGEAVVMSNIGGRITPGLLEQLGLLGRIGQIAGETLGGGGEFHVIILQHTDCGITRLAGDPAMLARYFQMEEGELKSKAGPERVCPSRSAPPRLTSARCGVVAMLAMRITWGAALAVIVFLLGGKVALVRGQWFAGLLLIFIMAPVGYSQHVALGMAIDYARGNE